MMNSFLGNAATRGIARRIAGTVHGGSAEKWHGCVANVPFPSSSAPTGYAGHRERWLSQER
jgi:hypothetical protein